MSSWAWHLAFQLFDHVPSRDTCHCLGAGRGELLPWNNCWCWQQGIGINNATHLATGQVLVDAYAHVMPTCATYLLPTVSTYGRLPWVSFNEHQLQVAICTHFCQAFRPPCRKSSRPGLKRRISGAQSSISLFLDALDPAIVTSADARIHASMVQ